LAIGGLGDQFADSTVLGLDKPEMALSPFGHILAVGAGLVGQLLEEPASW